MPRLVIFGAGGCGGDMLRAARHCYADVVYADDRPIDEYLGVPVIRPEEMRDSDELIVALGNGAARAAVIERLSHHKLATVIAPTAIIGPGVVIGEGAAVHDFAMLTSRSTIGRDCQINIRSSIGHDVVVGDNVTVGPHVVVGAFSRLENGAQIGIGATIRPTSASRGVRVGNLAKVGCGSVVMRSVADGQTVVGNPAQPLRAFVAVA